MQIFKQPHFNSSMRSKNLGLRLLCVFALLIAPAGNQTLAQDAGTVRYNSGSLEFFDGSIWNPMNQGDTGVSCTGQDGAMRLNTTPDPDRVEYCNGTNWQRIDATVTADSCTQLGEVAWYAADSMVRFCNGTNWVETKLSSSVPLTYFFVLSNGTWDGNLGGITGADAKCLADLQANDFLGKENATLNSSTVKAFICNDSYCNNPLADTEYTFASAKNSNRGSGTFTTNASGRGPGNATAWDGNNQFGADTEYWSGRANGTANLWPLTAEGSACANWSTTAGSTRAGRTSRDDERRYRDDSLYTCTTNNSLVCMVQPYTPSSNNFLVATSASFDGDLGGIGGADQACLDDLRTNDWQGKNNINLDESNVRAFLCNNFDDGVCNDLRANTTYAFATSGDLTAGGATFTTDANGLGPGDNNAWSGTSYFNFTDNYWMNRRVTDSTKWLNEGDFNHCNGWTNNTNSFSGEYGNPVLTGSGRWMNGSQNCDQTNRLLCVVEDTPRTGGHYFVENRAFTTTGGMAGLSGANDICLSSLKNSIWRGKENVLLNENTVRAWLCDGSSCQDTLPNTTYTFASNDDGTHGGATFTSDSSGSGPGNSDDWGATTHFGNAGVLGTWTGRSTGTSSAWGMTSDTNHCSGWTDGTSGSNGNSGDANSTNTNRWSTTSSTCDSNLALICLVDDDGDIPTPSVAFDFIDISGATTNTLYQVTTTLSGFAGEIQASVTGGDAQIRNGVSGTWGTTANMVSGDMLHLRMTSSASADTAITALVSMGNFTADWIVDTSAGASHHYFVRTSSVFASDMGGLSGADANCVSDLQANDWLGKSNVSVDASSTKAWLCDDSTCQDLQPNTTYTFAVSGSPATGGATFTTNVSSQGPGDTTDWTGSTYIGTTGQAYRTGRSAGTSSLWGTTSSGVTCSNWTSTSGSGTQGRGNAGDATRWNQTNSTCGNTRRLICAVDYTESANGLPDTFDFADLVLADPDTLYEVSSSVVTGFVGPQTASVTGGDAQIRVNDTGSWVTSGLAVNPGDTINLRMTSGSTVGAVETAVVTVGSGTADWNVSVAGGSYFVMTSTTMANGNLGGLAGADAACLSDLQGNNWLGSGNVTLNASTVKAWLCDGTVCASTLPDTTYRFARSGSATSGGASFTTDSSGVGPGDTTSWAGATYFNIGSAFVATGRAAGTNSAWATTSHTNTCNGWTSSLGTDTGRDGDIFSSSTGTFRWSDANNECDYSVEADRLICVVDDLGNGGSDGYFVQTKTRWDGNLGGLAGADAKCLSDLTTYNWKDKANAGNLTASRVKAFICDGTTCNNLEANTTYFFAKADDPSAGGNSFTTDGSGQGPGNTDQWDSAGYDWDSSFNWWSNRATGSNSLWGTTPDGTTHCTDWSSTAGNGKEGNAGWGGANGSQRWNDTMNACSAQQYIACFVNPN